MPDSESRASAGQAADGLRALAGAFGPRVKANEAMSRHTSFRIGGPADMWLEVESAGELARALEIARGQGIPVFLLGSGTNLLVADRGVRGLVLHLGRGFDFAEWTILGDSGGRAVVRAGASVPFKRLVYNAVERGFAGLEFGEGIPGSLGGGLLMNAGAFGGEIGRVVERLEGVDAGGHQEELLRERLDFRYRRLDLPAGWVVTAVRLVLERADAVALSERVTRARDKRKKGQPLGHPNAGSIFKNPPGAFAGKLLEEAQLKGLQIGGARISDRHANFIVNVGGALAADVRALMRIATERVLEVTGIRLEAEIKLVGEW